MTYTFVEAWATEVDKPLDDWDIGGGGAAAGDEFFKQLGQISKSVQEGKMTPADAARTKVLLQSFSNGLNALNAKVASKYGAPGGADDAKFAQAFKNLVSKNNLDLQRVTFALDEIVAGTSSGTQKALAATSNMLKNVGGVLGLMQIADEFNKSSFTAVGVNDAGKKALGVLTGMAFGELAAIAVGGLLALAGAPVIVVAAGAITGAVAIGYAAGKAGEALWEPYRWWYEERFLPGVFESTSQAYTTIVNGLGDAAVSLGRFDGTWLKELDLPAADKSAFTTLLAGVSRLPVSEHMNADIKKIFEVPFQADSLTSRDLLIQSILRIASQEGGYVTERVDVVEGIVTVKLAHGTAGAVAFRGLAEQLLDSSDRAGLAIAGSERIVFASGPSAINGSDKNELIIGSDGNDSLSGGLGNDELIAGDGGDTLAGGIGADVLFGGSGADQLDGGTGGDYLYGGAGLDTYSFSGAFGGDWIVDSDGQGVIKVDGVTLAGGKKIADGVYSDAASGWTYSLVNGDLFLSRDSSLNQIRIRDWTTGELGIVLDDSPAPPPPAQTTHFGDFKKKISTDGTRYIQDGLFNYISDGAEANANDVIYGGQYASKIYGLGGNDALGGGEEGDFIDGGDGIDIIQAGSGADTINGGAGVDVIFGSGNGQQWAPGSTDFELPTASGNVVIGAGFSWVLSKSETAGGGNFVYTDGVVHDQYEGDAGNIIDAGSGNDIVYAGSGSDRVHAGDDNDHVQGMGGHDVVFGEAGNDFIMGDGGDEPIYPSNYTPQEDAGNDILSGGDGNDHLVGQGADDALYGDDGDDRLYGDSNGPDIPVTHQGRDLLDGGAGNDKLGGGGNGDELYGGTGNDSLWGDAGAVAKTNGAYLEPSDQGSDYLDGEGGDDYLQGEGGHDTLYGGDGQDVLIGDDDELRLDGADHGDDYMDGEGGLDTLKGHGGDDTLYGGDDGDYLDGDADSSSLGGTFHGNDYLDGESGNDTLVGHGGDDTLLGGQGDDTVVGDETSSESIAGMIPGRDYIDGGDGNDHVEAGGNDDFVYGGDGDDYLDGDRHASDPANAAQGDDYLDGGAGNDMLLGRGGDDSLIGGDGNDSLVGDIPVGDVGADEVSGADYIDGGAGADLAEGGLGTDTMVGGLGNDTLKGDAGDDLLYGDSGDDGLFGGDGDDTLDGGAGTDFMAGGAGDDVYVVAMGESPLNAAGAMEAIEDTEGVNRIDFFGVDEAQLNSFINTAGRLEIRYSEGEGVSLSAASIAALGHVSVNGETQTFSSFIGRTSGGVVQATDASGKQIVFGGIGADVLTVNTQGARISGGRGNDRLTVSTSKGVTVEMGLGDGQDQITANVLAEGATPQRVNVLKLGEGIAQTDLELFGSAGSNDFFFKVSALGDGFQFTANKAASGAPVSGHQPFDVVQFADGSSVTWAGLLEDITFTVFPVSDGDDIVSLSAAGDVFSALAGNDSVSGLDGNDVINGMDGDDTLRGDGGNDQLDGGLGADSLDGGEGNDTLLGADGLDTLLGGNGDDVLRGGEDANAVYGGGGNDTMYGGAAYGFDTMYGGDGADHYVFNVERGYNSRAEAVDDSAVSDDVYQVVSTGSSGALYGTRAFNIRDAGGQDKLVFDSSWITPSSMSVSYTGTGFELRGWDNLRIGIEGTADAAGNFSISSVETVQFKDGTVWTAEQLRDKSQITTSGDDRVVGFNSDDTIDGGAGHDTLSGGGGADSVLGGAGYDLVNGGAGNDRLEAGSGGGRLVGDQGDDHYMVRSGDGDVLVGAGVRGNVGDAGFDTLEIAALASTVAMSIVRGGTTADVDHLVIAFNDGSSTVRVALTGVGADAVDSVEQIRFSDGALLNVSQFVAAQRASGTAGDDQITGWSLDDLVEGGSGSDNLLGNAGNDTLIGGIGNDTLTGGTGDNVLEGGVGDDRFEVGNGADSIRLTVGSGHDTLHTDPDASGQATMEYGNGISRQDVRVSWMSLPGWTTYGYSDYGWGSNKQLFFSGTLQFSHGLGDDVRFNLTTFTHLGDPMLPLAGIKLSDGSFVSLKDLLASTSGNDFIVAYSGDGGGGVMSGGAGDDTIYAFETGRVLDGGSGSDLLVGGDASDRFIGGTGNDTLQGYAGDNVYAYARGDGDDVVEFAEAYHYNTHTLELGAGISVSDVTIGRTYDGLVFHVSGGGSVTFKSVGTLAGFPDAVRFADGTVWSREQMWSKVNLATLGNDTLVGFTSADSLVGGDGDDVLVGLNGADTLMGGAGNDKLYANLVPQPPLEEVPNPAGNTWVDHSTDYLDGGAGSDELYESAGPTVFRFEPGFGHDQIFPNQSRPSSAVNKVQFGVGILPSDVRVSASGLYEYVLSIQSSGDTIEFNFGASDVVEFSDGTVWNKAALDSRIVAAITEAGDRISGTEGADVIASLGGADVVRAGEGNDHIDGGVGNDHLHGEGGDDTLTGGTGNDYLVGDAGNDRYQFNLGDGQDSISDWSGTSDVLAFGVGITAANLQVKSDPLGANSGRYEFSIAGTDDKLITEGIDSILFGDGTTWAKADFDALARTVRGTEGNDTMVGTSSMDRFLAGGGNDSLSGQASDDWLDGGSGADTMLGGSGNDTFVVDDLGDVVTESAGQGTDKVLSSITYTLPTNVETLELMGTASISGTGNSSANSIKGNAGDNTLSGGSGNDTLIGGAGNDSYVVDATGDVVTEAADEGVDSVSSAVTYTLGANVENLSLTGTSAINGTGNSVANQLTGNSGANRLDGGGGADTMFGGAGNDTYVVDNAGDTTTESAGAGTDVVESSITWALGAELENLTLTGTSAINGSGNALNNSLTGNSGANRLDGGAGNDTMIGGAGNDTYVVDSSTDVVTESSGGGADTVESSVTWTLGTEVENLTLTGSANVNATGNGLANTLRGNSGNNTLTGGSGVDTLIGGAGDDLYVLDVATDVVTEAAGEGTDTVQIGVTLATLSANVENVTLTGSSAINATGNALSNTLTGNSGANNLNGGDGNDTLIGGAGTDTLVGGLGDDTFHVDSTADVVTEASGAGTDTIVSSVTLTILAANVENLTLSGSSNLSGTGNALANVITGNSGANNLSGGDGNDTLDGGAGTDTLVGGLGNDTFYVDAATDVITEASGAGADTIMTSVTLSTLAANVENLTLLGSANLNATGSTGDNVLTGNAGNNTLTGNAGADTLDGKGGNDTLNGGVGADTYWFGQGYGADVIIDVDSTANVKDVVRFSAGIAQGDIQFTQSGNALVATIRNTSDSLTIQDWYVGTQNRVEEFRFNDGTVLTSVQAQALVGAMAAFNPAGPSIAMEREPGHQLVRGSDIAVAATA